MARQKRCQRCNLKFTPTLSRDEVVCPSCLADSDCKHTPSPNGYIQWHEWAEKMEKTHVQERCPICGLWAIWKARAGGSETSGAAHADLCDECKTRGIPGTHKFNWPLCDECIRKQAK